MARPSPAALALVAVLAAGLTGGCRTAGFAPAELDPMAPAYAPRAALPDEAERAAGRVAALVLGGHLDQAAERLEVIRAEDTRRREAREPVTGLADNALDVIVAAEGWAAYERHARRVIDEGSADPVLERRLQRFLDERPMARAERHLHEDRTQRFASFFNRLAPALSRLAIGRGIEPIEATRTALAAWQALRAHPRTTTRQRQALRALELHLDRHPDAPDAERVAARAAELRARLDRERYASAMDRARDALEVEHPAAARLHLARADRLVPGQPGVARLRERADHLERRSDERILRSLAAGPEAGGLRAVELLSLTALTVPAAHLEERGAQAGLWPGPLDDERAFLATRALRARGEEDRFFETLGDIAELDPARSNMARHAASLVSDPAQNPYAFYRRAIRSERAEFTRWLLLGSRAHGAARRGLFRPLEWVLDIPGFATALLTTPIRLTQMTAARARLAAGVLRHGTDYVARFPHGVHAADVHAALESRFAARQHWTKALAHHRAGGDVDPDRARSYREKAAERMLGAADAQPRRDAHIAILRSVAQDYSDLEAGRRAGEALRELYKTATPQSIRVSREFLLENPALRGPGALGLRPELFDGDRDNGELGEDGVTLIGQTQVRIALRGREPVVRRVPERDFARFVSLLEEASYERLVSDSRETATADPQRDLFFERARLGLLDEPDLRPSASSGSEFLGTVETHGLVKRARNVLPVEIVLRGGLEDLGFAAFPRIRTAPPTEDAFLYR